jgi:phosphate transport system permease protein
MLTEAQVAAPDWTGPLTPSGNLRRRAAVNRFVTVGATSAAVIAVGLLAIIIYDVISHGAGVLSPSFVIHNPNGYAGGGIGNMLIGTGLIVGFASLIAVPVGVLTGLFLTEFVGASSRVGRALKLALDLMQGLPTIVVGLFVYGLIVIPQGKQTGWAAAVALSIVMLPLVARASQEVLLLVPGSLRDAADALGVARWRTVLGVILPTAAGGIATGAILAAARAAGETAPVLVTNSLFTNSVTQFDIFGHGVPTVPMYIYLALGVGGTGIYQFAWGAAFVLLAGILLANVLARVLLARSRRKRMGG